MAFVNTGNTNTLELNLTDYGKSILVGNSGGDLLNQIVKFGLKDSDIDYRRFTGNSVTESYGPCYAQSSLYDSKIEALSGECFYNYPDVRGRYGSEVCNMAVLQGPDTNGTSILFNPKPTGYLWYTLNEDLESKQCFKQGHNTTNLGLNEYGCKCAQFGLYSDELISDGIRPGYPTYTDVIQMFHYTVNSKLYETGDKYLVGDFTGEGVVSCDDFCWVIDCYGKGISEIGEDNKKFESRIQRNQVGEMLNKISCKCGDYNTEINNNGTFVCPADKKRYKNTPKNKENCQYLLNTKNKKKGSSNKKSNNTISNTKRNVGSRRY